jgi:chemotaxis protein CheC
MEKLNFNEQDLLTEVGTIGTGHAATAMADILGQKITITVPNVELVSFNRVAEYIGASGSNLACIYFDVLGDLPGTVLVMFTENSARRLLNTFMPDEPLIFLELSQLQQSALMEMGNILSGAYLTALADFSNQRMSLSVPRLAVDMAEAMLSVPLIKLGSETDRALLIQARFFEESSNRGYIVFFPNQGATTRLLEIFGVGSDG